MRFFCVAGQVRFYGESGGRETVGKRLNSEMPYSRLLLFCVNTSRDWLKRTRATFPPIRSKTEYGKLRIVPGTRGFVHVDPNQTGQCLKHLFIPSFLKTGLAKIRTHSTTWKLKTIKFVAL